MSAIPLTGKGRVTLNLAMLINMLSIGQHHDGDALAADLASPLNMPPQYAGYIAGLAGLAAALAAGWPRHGWTCSPGARCWLRWRRCGLRHWPAAQRCKPVLS
ncbi:hypothetical protein UMZ34_17780 [Halopseudomonas pachastrellae]|nr:hypothetical protein UMZ34_17780 [Halopseudomonas pachastrellae]